MSKAFKVRFQDYTSKERTIRVVSEVITSFFFILFIVLSIISFINQEYSYGIVYLILLVLFIIPNEILEHDLKSKVRIRKIKTYYSTEEMGREEQLKNILIGMAQSTGKINIKYLAKQLKVNAEKLKVIIFDLVGSQLLMGKMKGNDFILEKTDKSAIPINIIKTPEKSEPSEALPSKEELKNLPGEILKHYEEYRWADKRIPERTKNSWKQKIPYLALDDIDKLIAGFHSCIEQINSDEKYYMDTQIPHDDANYLWWEAREPYEEWLKYLYKIKNEKI